MRVLELIERIDKFDVTNESQFLRSCGVGLRYLAEGSYRASFEVIGMPVILKVPLTNCYSDLDHAAAENRAIKALLTNPKFRKLRKYAPRVYYFDEEHGLTLMRKYEPVMRWNKEIEHLGNEVEAVTGYKDHDIGCGNVGKDSDGSLKLIDLGMLMEGS